MKCHWHKDKGQRIRIPGCYGAALHWGDSDHGAAHCTCYPRPKTDTPKKDPLELRIEHIEKHLGITHKP